MACGSCKTRKIKCDGNRPTCTSCINLAKSKGYHPSNIVCVYPPPAKWTQAANKILDDNLAELRRLKAVEDLEERLQIFEDRLETVLSLLPQKLQQPSQTQGRGQHQIFNPSLSFPSTSAPRAFSAPSTPLTSLSSLDASYTSSHTSSPIRSGSLHSLMYSEPEDDSEETLENLRKHFPISSMLSQLPNLSSDLDQKTKRKLQLDESSSSSTPTSEERSRSEPA